MPHPGVFLKLFTLDGKLWFKIVQACSTKKTANIILVCTSHVGWYFRHPQWNKETHWEKPAAIYTIIYDMLEEIVEPDEDAENVTMYAMQGLLRLIEISERRLK